MEHMKKFAFRKVVNINDISSEMNVHAVFRQDALPQESEGDKINLPTEKGMSEDLGYVAAVDPRLKNLGSRTICLEENVDLEGLMNVGD